jgi:hypothetical protein
MSARSHAHTLSARAHARARSSASKKAPLAARRGGLRRRVVTEVAAHRTAMLHGVAAAAVCAAVGWCRRNAPLGLVAAGDDARRGRREGRANQVSRHRGSSPAVLEACFQHAAWATDALAPRRHRGAMPTAARDVASQARQGAAAALVHRGFCAQAPTPLRMQPAPLASARRTRGGRGGSASHRRATGCLCRTAACRPWPARHGDGWMDAVRCASARTTSSAPTPSPTPRCRRPGRRSSKLRCAAPAPAPAARLSGVARRTVRGQRNAPLCAAQLADDERPLESHELRARVRHYLSEQVPAQCHPATSAAASIHGHTRAHAHTRWAGS